MVIESCLLFRFCQVKSSVPETASSKFCRISYFTTIRYAHPFQKNGFFANGSPIVLQLIRPKSDPAPVPPSISGKIKFKVHATKLTVLVSIPFLGLSPSLTNFCLHNQHHIFHGFPITGHSAGKFRQVFAP